ncbi:LLM class flavin-dependent oxidoreductase [Promicromonospora sp. NFX87]|uniref:LLM class flavin-dependent oxidoreductase n=1 Tax=Promicromonospora sp. NFX87 TaxID=3402691 RepID=UPI003AFA60E7
MTTHIRSAFWLPVFDELADPRVVARLAAEAEEVGWDGFFLWDHIAWAAPVQQVGDPWISLAAAATATESIRLGPMVTPVARRRPVKLARETASLDQLSGGRLTLGVGLGSDVYGAEFVSTGEAVDARVRAELLDETLDILTAAWSGLPVRHRGKHYVVDDITFLPTPVQERRVPVWVAGYAGRVNPMRRAARFDGYFPIGFRHPDQIAELRETISGRRPDPSAPYDLVVPVAPGADPTEYAAAGATWCLTELDPDEMTLDHVRGVLRDGPPTTSRSEAVAR